jgi:cation-transporting ATPase F
MATAVALGMMLAFEPAEPDIMRRPPRSPGEPIITGLMLRRIAVVGTVMLAGTFVAFALAVQGEWSEDEARTIAVNALVAMEIAYLLACRSLRGSLRSVGFFSNRWIWIGVAIMVILQLAFTYVPFMNTAFQTAALPLSGWLSVLVLMPLMYGIVSVLKWWERSRLQSNRA